eukprot:m.37759 g.37759  ORF g.37759 m.37759 type:complete len:317 (-) comp5463_c0_seq2:168-1118(-)
MATRSPLVARKSSPAVMNTKGSSPKISPRGSKDTDHLQPIRASESDSKSSKSNPSSGKGSPLTVHKTINASAMANPTGSLQHDEVLKSWEVRGLKHIEWKKAHGKHWKSALVRFLHGTMSGYADDTPGQSPVFEVSLEEMKEKAVVISTDEEHQYVIKTPAEDIDDWILLAFPSAEAATRMLARADPERFPLGLRGKLTETPDQLNWRITVMPEEKDGHIVYTIIAHSPNDLPGRPFRLYAQAQYGELRDEHLHCCKVAPEGADIPFPPWKLLPSKDPEFLRGRAVALRDYFSQALKLPGVMMWWRNSKIFRCQEN